MNLLNITDLEPKQIRKIVEKSLEFKKGLRTESLKGKNVVLLFEKPSLRTKLGFFKAINILGGSPIYFGPEEIGMGKREPIKDISKVVSRMADIASRHNTIDQKYADFTNLKTQADSSYTSSNNMLTKNLDY